MTKKKILIVEDNELNLKLFTDILEANDFEVFANNNGVDVPADVRKIQPNVIIMDIQLPNISGMDIISELKIDEELKPIPIIAVTAFALQEDKDNILSTGCDEYISKPISINIFLETIKKYI